jgi:hypothetical protein
MELWKGWDWEGKKGMDARLGRGRREKKMSGVGKGEGIWVKREGGSGYERRRGREKSWTFVSAWYLNKYGFTWFGSERRGIVLGNCHEDWKFGIDSIENVVVTLGTRGIDSIACGWLFQRVTRLSPIWRCHSLFHLMSGGIEYRVVRFNDRFCFRTSSFFSSRKVLAKGKSRWIGRHSIYHVHEIIWDIEWKWSHWLGLLKRNTMPQTFTMAWILCRMDIYNLFSVKKLTL